MQVDPLLALKECSVFIFFNTGSILQIQPQRTENLLYAHSRETGVGTTAVPHKNSINAFGTTNADISFACVFDKHEIPK